MLRKLISGHGKAPKPRLGASPSPAGSRQLTRGSRERPRASLLGAVPAPSKITPGDFVRQSTYRSRETGVTAIGWLVLLTPFAIVLYACIRLAPIYLNYLKVAHTLSDLTVEFGTGGASPETIRGSIQKHFEIDSVDYPTIQDISISRDGDGWQVEAAYYDQAPLFAHITLQVAFDKTVVLSGGG